MMLGPARPDLPPGQKGHVPPELIRVWQVVAVGLAGILLAMLVAAAALLLP